MRQPEAARPSMLQLSSVWFPYSSGGFVRHPRPTGTRRLLRDGKLIRGGGEANMQQLQRIAIYARVSSEPHSSSQTIASQLEALQARVSSDGQRLPAEQCFVDDGYSGATLLRPALERLRDLAAAGGLDRVYVHSPDRLARHYMPTRCC